MNLCLKDLTWANSTTDLFSLALGSEEEEGDDEKVFDTNQIN